MHNYGRFRSGPEPQNYFRNLAHSFLNGRLDIDCPRQSGCYDLLKYEGKNYLYWPPAPAVVFYAPLVAMLGVDTPDKLISSLIGAFNVLLFSVLLRLFSRRFSIPINFSGIALLTLFWGMGTVHFYMSMKGSIWCLSQVCAQTFLLLSFIFALLPPRIWRLLLSGVCFGLACYTRNHLVFCALALAIIHWYSWDTRLPRERVKLFILWGIPFLIFSVLNLLYNYARFDEALNNGMEYQHMSSFLQKDFETYGFFNLHYLPKNIWVQVISPPAFSENFPFFKLGWHKEGFSFFWASPLFLLLLPTLVYFFRTLWQKKESNKLQKKDQWMISGALASMLLVATPILLNIAPGWRQFASRYSLDYQLMMILIGLFLIKVCGDRRWLVPLSVVLVFLSLYMNYFGTYEFLGLGK